MELSQPTGVPLAAAHARMPALADGTHAHSHSVHSALVSLGALGVQAGRIVLRRTGREGRTAGAIVRQSPPAGTPLTAATLVHLDIAGLGFSHALPVGMWDSGGEAAAGTREILEPFDDPLEKLKHWFHEGAPLFRIAPDDPFACGRWLGLFGIDAELWPRSLWYRLASLIANIAQLSCSKDGCAFVLDVLLGLPVHTFSYHPTSAALPSSALSKLGSRASRLGVDLLVGDAVEDLARLEIEVGPVPLAVYEYFAETETGASLLRRVLELIMPISTAYEIHWSVGNCTEPPRLGIPAQNSRLGINTYMGAALGTQPSPGIFDPRADAPSTSGEVLWSQA